MVHHYAHFFCCFILKPVKSYDANTEQQFFPVFSLVQFVLFLFLFPLFLSRYWRAEIPRNYLVIDEWLSTCRLIELFIYLSIDWSIICCLFCLLFRWHSFRVTPSSCFSFHVVCLELDLCSFLSGCMGLKELVNGLHSIDHRTSLSQFSSVQSLSHVRPFATPWITARQVSLSITNPRSLLKLMSIELVMPSSHLILCCPLLLLPPIPPSIRVFSNESTLHMRWPEYWSFSFSISCSNEYPGLISFRMDWLDLLAVQGTLKSLLQHRT